MKSHSITEVLPLLDRNHKLINYSERFTFDNAKPLNEANDRSIVWVSVNNKNKFEAISLTRAQTIICDLSIAEDAGKISSDKCIILVEDPRLCFLRIVRHFFEYKPEWGIHKTAAIHANAVIDPQSYIGPNCYVGESTIGKGTIIYGNCFIYDNVVIGDNVTIHAGTVIGADGFGYQRNEKNEFEKFPHIGGVIIDSNVDIGANTCIDRGTLGNTHIKAGAKIDNLVHIAHNVIIGKHSAIIAHAMIGGSTVVEDFAWVAPSAALRDGLVIGESSIVGLGAVVTKSVPKNEVWAGNPARQFSK
jgi:UDP-3-O-[3-hydroxymyristoyl] glucosamine N-acyltransferase